MKKLFAVLLAIIMVLSFAACSGGEKEKAVTVEIDGYLFGFTVTGIGKGDSGNTVINMEMAPVANSEGEIITDFFQSLQVAGMFLVSPYIVADGEEYIATNDLSQMVMKGSEEGHTTFAYVFELSTDKDPDELWIAPAGAENDKTMHYKISLKDFTIEQKPTA